MLSDEKMSKRWENAPLRNSVLRLEDPMAMGNDGGFRPYRDTGALIPAADQTECPLAMRGLPSLHSGAQRLQISMIWLEVASVPT